MRPDTAATPQPVRLADYRPPAWLVDHVDLTFRLHPTATRVVSRIRFRPNPEAPGPFRLDGEGLRLIRATIDGVEVTPRIDATGLTVEVPAAPFLWEAEVEVDPQANTALDGLYLSNGMFCTQCEAEGFRRITFYPDRPDVLAPFNVRIDSDLAVLLSNGNPAASGPGWAEWHDPWPKPAYLFALVAGDLLAHRDRFTTRSGRRVDLAIWVRPGDEGKCAYAMDALKRSMAWDEREYGREYDLDVFNIVAVDDFNMGAMENKGLNIFNAKYVLASPETATDTDYENIESIVAHEYFHNWTGNRITCRDWFQLSLKEGLTVFRDQQFSGHERSAAVQRIHDVIALRARQFREDAGPLAHPVQPESYIEINNFYTATVYEKGAELIGMLRRLVGAAGYRAALDLYFERHDGQACTIDDWLRVFEDATGRDLGPFRRWYTTPGTPHVDVAQRFENGEYRLTLRQSLPTSPARAEEAAEAPLVIPIAVGLIGPNGAALTETRIVELTETEQSFTFTGLGARPVASINRGFSAPIILTGALPDPAFLLAHDSDPFNRWEAARTLAKRSLTATLTNNAPPDAGFLDALGRALGDASDPGFLAALLALPSEDDIAETLHGGGITPDPLAIHSARRSLRRAIARAHDGRLAALFGAMETPGPYSPAAEPAARRALRLAALGYLTETDGGARARDLFAAADNMTEGFGALTCLAQAGLGQDELAAFHAGWRHDRLVLDKWFALQAATAAPDVAVETVRGLTAHADFDWTNPNRFRALLGSFARANPAGFHDPSGAGYALYADWLIRLDPRNPQTAAGMATAFETLGRYDPDRQALMRHAMNRIAARPGCSRDMTEMLGRMAPDHPGD
jgi:aminopeptidase N